MMLVAEVVFISDNKVEDIEFRKANITTSGEIVFTPLTYEECKKNKVIGILAKGDKLIITV